MQTCLYTMHRNAGDRPADPENRVHPQGLTPGGCEALRDVAIPDAVDDIMSGAFSGCRSLREIAIPAGTTRIMGGAYDAGFGDVNAIIQNAAAKPGTRE